MNPHDIMMEETKFWEYIEHINLLGQDIVLNESHEQHEEAITAIFGDDQVVIDHFFNRFEAKTQALIELISTAVTDVNLFQGSIGYLVLKGRKSFLSTCSNILIIDGYVKNTLDPFVRSVGDKPLKYFRGLVFSVVMRKHWNYSKDRADETTAMAALFDTASTIKLEDMQKTYERCNQMRQQSSGYQEDARKYLLGQYNDISSKLVYGTSPTEGTSSLQIVLDTMLGKN